MEDPRTDTVRRVSELGELLELMHGARNRYRTVRATIREWRHEGRWQKAWQCHLASLPREGAGQVLVGFGGLVEEPPPESETILRLWLE